MRQSNKCGSVPTIREGIAIAEKIYLFANTNVSIDKDDPFGRSKNFESLYYKSISSVSTVENVSGHIV